MASQRHSDENLNPDVKLNQNAAVTKRRLSAQEKRHNQMFAKSGMKKGAMFRYLQMEKKKQEQQEAEVLAQQQQQQATTSAHRVMSTVNRESAPPGRSISEQNNNDAHPDPEEEQRLSQDSSVIFEGEFDPKAQIELIDLDEHGDPMHNNGEDSSVERNGSGDPDSPDGSSPQPETSPRYYSSSSCSDKPDCMDDQEGQNSKTDGDPLNLPDFEEPMNASDRVERWQKINKRSRTPEANGDDDFQPTPNKTSRPTPSPGLQPQELRREQTPDRSSNISCCSGAPMKITSVYSVAPTPSGSDSIVTTVASTSNEVPSSSNNSKVKKAVFRYKQSNNPQIETFIRKSNWKKALDLMNKDLKKKGNDKLPKPAYVSPIIRRAILCDGPRVAKQVQSDALDFLQALVTEYPPLHGSRKDSSVEYYKQILEGVFEDSSNKDRPAKLYELLEELCSRVEVELKSNVERNALRLLIFVTDLVVNQFKEYEKESVKVKPPLFQHFFEDREGIYHYGQFCSNLVKKLFATTSPDMRCIYLKWLDLIARSFGAGALRSRDNEKLVIDVAEHCRDRSETDYGLFLFLNIEYKPFSKQVCEKIFESLSVKAVNAHSQIKNAPEIRSEYLKRLAGTLLFKPADGVVSELCTKTCSSSEQLTYKITRFEKYRDRIDQDGKKNKKNTKGETRLHTLCNNNNLENPIPEVRKHITVCPGDVNEQDNFGNTPLHDCAVKDKGNIILELRNLNIRRKIPVKIDFLIRNQSLETALHLAASYCVPENVQKLKQFASECGSGDEVLMAPNEKGALPFELAENDKIRVMLKPRGYNVDEMFTHEDITMDLDSIETLKSSFSFRQVIAWWKRYCD